MMQPMIVKQTSPRSLKYRFAEIQIVDWPMSRKSYGRGASMATLMVLQHNSIMLAL